MKFFASPARLFRFAGLLLFSAGFVYGHNPSSSWATVRIAGDTIELKVEMARETAWLFLGNTLDSAPDIDHSVPKLRAAAPNVYRLSLGDRVLTPKETGVELRDEDGVQFRLVFVHPKGEPLVRFEPGYLKRLAADHRTTLTLLDPADNVLRGEIMNPKKTAVDLKLPAPGPVSPAKP
ncbi:MAG TPA: hypothetical protein VHO24_13130 [Opitutaceae bacterium]|nr:hypothetical protein [Opitutaceae bacterium]